MKNTISLLAISVALLTGCQKDDDSENNSKMVDPITAQETLDLQFLIEEEKLARDVYLFSAELYDLNIFDHIASSEQSHIDRIEGLLEFYDIENPIIGLSEGEFANQSLQELYHGLTAAAEISLLDALVAGATIEDLDISDIEGLVTNTDKDNLLEAYSSLACGSRNHLRAFMKKIDLNAGEYSPQFISEDLFNEIVTSSNEQCGQ